MRNFQQALPIDAARRIRNLKRRRRYHQMLDRPKVWPGDKSVSCRWTYRQPDAVIDTWYATLTHPVSTEAYVTAWYHLNHLREY